VLNWLAMQCPSPFRRRCRRYEGNGEDMSRSIPVHLAFFFLISQPMILMMMLFFFPAHVFHHDDPAHFDDRHHRDDLVALVHYIMSMSILEKLSTSSNTRHHLIIAIITIVKHATTLRPSGLLPRPALAQAESDYKKLNIGSKAASYFTGPLQQYSVQQIVDFIVGADLSLTDVERFLK